MELKVREKTFKITLVNNYVHEQYAEMVSLANDLIDDLPIEEAAGKKELRQVVKDKRRIRKELVDLRQDIIREILESNGYEFDQLWWERRTDPDDSNLFMLSCVRKDTKPGVEKKK